ncbi:NAD(+) diphosphatase [Acidocella aminolytica]|jgi:NAD+ diphosphatase|uniref:NAD(+) diphosphatase n=1 Tax=Acidocella aminolytica 101 = DSM 11237 TaxID=1120923 RepID=A0A0D6PHC7_9PROT|nr:NAD(+) diphosphatase [Acidocella aminolytica]GAN80776.1 phosphohydrolase/NUDIX hydrolase [Acidocella aminolytica 101 = DSM 11237]GBQ42406.1 NUDIX hydrolase [Acidocella aminolytica 101 = DSM 11237]SHE33792.1 NAD+ diphosphatase [Acidocella aminolytica 101 = DSM 11237]
MDFAQKSRPNHYSSAALDRAAHLRENACWLARAAKNSTSRYVLLHEGKVLIEESGETPRARLLPPLGLAPDLFLGLTDGLPVFALDFSERALPDGITTEFFRELRGLTALLPMLDAALLATARGIFNWRATHKYCPRCGGTLTPHRAGWVLHCAQCKKDHFPRTDSAVIMLVTKGEVALLGQSHRFPPEWKMYSTLAGFVEPGESLEDAVRREVFEEAGIEVGAVHYHSSQPWPFPASLMLGFHAEGLSEDIVLQDDEMRDARWFSRTQIRDHAALGFGLPPHDSIARRLIEDWLAQP